MKILLTLSPRDELFERLGYPFEEESIPRNIAYYVGRSCHGSTLSNPELPREMDRLDLHIRYRGHSLDLRLTRDSLTIRGQDAAAAPITLCVNGEVCEFVSGTTRVFRLHDDAPSGAKLERNRGGLAATEIIPAAVLRRDQHFEREGLKP